jgi:DNA (cytosine-5)-methyltransferase 1
MIELVRVCGLIVNNVYIGPQNFIMKILDLFSGIGGFSYAAERLVGGFETVAFCEQDEFCKKILHKHWPTIPIINDVKELADNADEFRGIVDIVCGGFPCQPVSVAGLQRADQDDRYLWEEMFRVIQGCQPKWVIAENVTGLINIKGGVLFESVQADLESEGYSVQSVVLPAASKNAPHRRDRVWIIAHTRLKHGFARNATELDKEQTEWASRTIHPESSGERQSDSTDTDSQRLQRQRKKSSRAKKKQHYSCNESWGSTESRIRRVDDGIPSRLDRFDGWDREPEDIPRVATGIKNRTERLKSLGNSIVPQVVAEIFRAIKETEQ